MSMRTGLFGGLWRHRDFRSLWAAETVSHFGTQVSLLALPLTAALALEASPAEMGVLGAAKFAPFLLFGLLAGVWVDRLRRRPILVVANLGRAAVLASVPVAALLGALTMLHLYMVAFVVGVLTVAFDVAYQSFLPALVKRQHLVEGNSKLEVSRSVAQIAGPGLAGGLVELLTAPVAIAVDALSFLISAVFLGRITAVEAAPAAHSGGRNIWREIGEGLQVVAGNPILRGIAGCTATINLFSSMGEAVFILFLTRELGVPPGYIGVIFGLASIGGLAGALLASRVAQRFGVGPTIVGSTLLTGLGTLLLPFAGGSLLTALLVILLANLLVGLGIPIYNITQVSLRQAITPDHLQGRMNATMRFLVWGTIPIGALIGGLLGEIIGLRATLLVGGLGALLALGWVVTSPVRLLTQAPSPASEPTALST